MFENRCVCCNELIPEGQQVCYSCMKARGIDVCDCYHTRDKRIRESFYGKAIRELIGECWGTRERDECACGGDPSKCDFYPEKRKKYKGASDTMTCNIKTYIKEKIKLLNQLCIRLTNEQLEHLLSLETEIAVDNYAHDIICKGDE